MDFIEYLEKYNAQEKINKLARKYKNKKIAIYGAGQFAVTVFENYNLSKLNIIAVADRKFENEENRSFFNLNCIPPKDLGIIDCDVILIANFDYQYFINLLDDHILYRTKNAAVEVRPLIKLNFKDLFLQKQSCNSKYKGKVCSRPFHILNVTKDGISYTCCPAYLRNKSIGNIQTQDINEVWYGEKAETLRMMMMKSDYSCCDMDSCIQFSPLSKSEIKQKYYKNGNLLMPDELYIGWDYDCNVACITCRDKLFKNSCEDKENFDKIIENISQSLQNLKQIYISGNGDPFASSKAREFLAQTSQNYPQIKYIIHSNGILCTEKICKELGIKDKITSVIFSIHASSKETYEKIVRFGNFEKVLENARWIGEMKQNGKIQAFTFVFVVENLNYQEMPSFVKLAQQYSATASFRHYRQWKSNSEYNYNEMAICDKNHPDHNKLLEVLKNKAFDEKNCIMDELLLKLRKAALASQ